MLVKPDLQNFIDCLADAEKIIERDGNTAFRPFLPALTQHLPEQLNCLTIEQLLNFTNLESSQKPLVRMVQHLSCTGGSIISKCLAALPNVALLSEVNPNSRQHIGKVPRFSPTDLTALAIYNKFPLIEELSKNIFYADVSVLVKHTTSLGKHLLLREHSHSDFLAKKAPVSQGTIETILGNDFRLLSAITVRNPVDSYLSLVKNNWVEFSPSCFDEYCRRYSLFIQQNAHIPRIKYEHFILDPEAQIKHLSKVLELPYDEDFMEMFDAQGVTGNSGRKSKSITKRKRREYDQAFYQESQKSFHYKNLCQLLNYRPIMPPRNAF